MLPDSSAQSDPLGPNMLCSISLQHDQRGDRLPRVADELVEYVVQRARLLDVWRLSNDLRMKRGVEHVDPISKARPAKHRDERVMIALECVVGAVLTEDACIPVGFELRQRGGDPRSSFRRRRAR